MEINRIDAGVYRVHSDYEEASIHFTAQELRELFDWCMIHMRELEAEATRAVQEAQLHADKQQQ
jgi:hypothetical protein